jgi:hypothetical protein
MIQRTLLILALLFSATSSFADEIRPGYLELKENSENVFSVLWKVPAKGNRKLSLHAKLPDNCKDKTQPVSQLVNAAYIQRWLVVCEEGLFDKTLSISGLKSTNTDVLLRLEFIDGTSQSILLTPTQESFKIPASASSLQIIRTYTWLGITHILMGVDHLLFVFALLLIVNGKRRLLWTITAFTLAHSLTLAGATLGFINVPQQPVEAVIEQAIPLALVFFNVGVELGQLLFVAVVLSLGYLLHKLKLPKLLEWSESIAIYSIGGLSSFWLFERISAF